MTEFPAKLTKWQLEILKRIERGERLTLVLPRQHGRKTFLAHVAEAMKKINPRHKK